MKSNTVSATECLHYAMTMPTSVVITGIDSMPILDQALEAVKTFEPLDQNQLTALLARTADAAKYGATSDSRPTRHLTARRTIHNGSADRWMLIWLIKKPFVDESHLTIAFFRPGDYMLSLSTRERPRGFWSTS